MTDDRVSTKSGPEHEMLSGPEVHPLGHKPNHREDWRGRIADKDCEACRPLFAIFGSQIVDEPFGPFEARVLESRRRLLAAKMKKREAPA